uniref:Uncharacterized protein n=1 Tax=Acrobeloides nanus TaxID=290746 RepID=A0A914CB43_9BILA
MLHSRCVIGRKPNLCHNKPVEDSLLGLIDFSNQNLWRLPDEVINNADQIQHLILDGNELDESVWQHIRFENLRTLSLNANKVKNIGVLVQYLSRKCPKLTFLSLIGNPGWPYPIHNLNSKKKYRAYIQSIKKMLPNLQFLDSMQVRCHNKKIS